jgi:D-tyrosyl-tRNA(Tyr) deacylase
MRVVIQRVSNASVSVENSEIANIKAGLVVLLGIEHEDNQQDVEWLTGKISQLRIFNDESRIMNLSVKDVNADILVVSQFTLHAMTKKGNRPSYIRAANPSFALPLYEFFIKSLSQLIEKDVLHGQFGAMMDVSLTNSGPVTIFIDSKNRE